jgi:DNA-binding MarR family transcriptional regulator
MPNKNPVLKVPESYTPDRYDIYWNSFLPIFFDRMNSTMRRHMTEEVSKYGLTSAHAVYLIALILEGSMTLIDMSRFLDMDPANTNRVIKVLRDKGLVYDDRKNPDSRGFTVYLTEKGRDIGQSLMDSTTEWMNWGMEGISREEILSMRNVLIKILDKIDPDLETYMASEYDRPFYTYLHTNPPNAEPHLFESIRADEGKSSSKKQKDAKKSSEE